MRPPGWPPNPFSAFLISQGDDLHRFDSEMGDKAEFYRRQVVGSTKFRTGGDLTDFLHGWLNYQIEHHLFPQICHVHYPAIAAIVEETSREFGVKYYAHRTTGGAIASHFRWLRQMGSPIATA